MLVFLNITFNKVNMSYFWITRSPIVAILFILPHALVAVVDLTSCSPCDINTCLEPCLLVACPQECPVKYYPTSLACEKPTTTARTTKAPTTSTPTTTPTTTTTTTPRTTPTTTKIMTPVVVVTGTHIASTELNATQHHIRRRQAPETTQEKSVMETSETTTLRTTPVTTTPTTTKTTTRTTTTTTTTIKTTTTTRAIVTCRLCSLDSCSLCKDDSQNKSVCAECQDGYSLSNDRASCSKGGLSGGAIAGIVIGALCFMAALAVGTFFLVRRFRWSKDGTDTEHARTTRSCEDDSEQYELGKLPDAPSPPAEDTTKRYDSLKPTNKDDKQSYSPLEIPKESQYANCEAPHKNIYANTPDGSTTGPSASERKNSEEEPVSSDHVQLYEPIDTTGYRGDQGTYANAEAIGQHKKAAETAPSQAVYYNDSGDTVENVYANP